MEAVRQEGCGMVVEKAELAIERSGEKPAECDPAMMRRERLLFWLWSLHSGGFCSDCGGSF